MELLISVDLKQLEKWKKKVEKNMKLDQFADQAGRAGVRILRTLVPRRTGRLASSFRHQLTTRGSRGTTVKIWTDVPYANILNDGASAHLITASGKALRFRTGSGEMLFRKTVMHPGVRAYNFTKKGAELMQKYLQVKGLEHLVKTLGAK